MRIEFRTTGRTYQDDIDLVGHSTFMEESALVPDVTPYKRLVNELFGTLDIDLDRFYDVTLDVEPGQRTVRIVEAEAVPPAPAATPDPMSEQEIARNAGEVLPPQPYSYEPYVEASAAAVVTPDPQPLLDLQEVSQ